MIKIVGTGISGCVLARILAENGKRVEIYEQSNNIGGLLYDYVRDGYLVSDSGVHIFHTKDKQVLDFITQYGTFVAYNHIVSADVYNTNFAINFPPSLNARLKKEQLSNLYTFYSHKQWNKMPSQEVIDRVKGKDNNSLYFFSDKYVGLPLFGWTDICENLLAHKNIHIHLNHLFTLKDIKKDDIVYYSGRLDKLFDFKYGAMEYRTIRILYSEVGNDFANVMNKSIPDVPYTRIINWRRCSPTIVQEEKDLYGYEFSFDASIDDVAPHYIVGGQDELYNKYKQLCKTYNIVPFGRIGNNKYINIDEAIKCAMTLPL